MRTFIRCPLHNPEFQRNGTALHRDSPLLFVFPAVKVPHLARHARGDDVVSCEEGIHERRLSMIDVADGCDDSNACWIGGFHLDFNEQSKKNINGNLE